MHLNDIYDELSRELISKDAFKSTYEALLKHQYIGTRKEAHLNFNEIKFLLETASIFSHSSHEEFKQMAYKIASIISLNYSDQYDQLNRAIQYLFISLGQLPVVKKNIEDGNPDYFSIYSETENPFNPIQFKDVLYKQIINQIPIEFDHQTIFLTDFQRKLYTSLTQGKSVSVSAPTSSGKSFLLKAYISKQLKERERLNVVYIVPTRALISEVSRDFKSGFRHFNITEVTISSAPSSYNKEKFLPKKMFVLTQERYHNLLFDVEFDETIDILIIDEAQKVSDGARGIILEEVIEESLRRFPDIQIIFISPFAKNPEKFAKIFHLDSLHIEKTKLSPVSQNLFLVDVGNKQYSLSLTTAELENKIAISSGNIDEIEKIPFKKADDWKLLWAVKKFGGNFNIVYCNSSKKCLNLAQTFSSNLREVKDDEIDNAIDFMKENIHDDYYLIDCLKKGVAYHHGKIPNQIRMIIEDLFRSKKLNYIFCTSTLLEGVNFPAQNIFIKNPREGKMPMSRLSFWNLAGRAGRLLKDYYGNIYCINLDQWKGYKPDPRDIEHEIESILEKTLINKNREIMEYLKDVYHKLKEEDKPIEQAITKFIIHELKAGKTDFIENLLKRNPDLDHDKIKALRNEIQNLANGIELPAQIIQKNSSIDPRRQQKLLETFENKVPAIPLHPIHRNFLNSIREIYKFINFFFENKNDNSYKFFALLASKWIREASLKELIEFQLYNIRKKSTPTKKMINSEIENLFENINYQIRYAFQRYLKCYIDVLKYFYEKSGYDTAEICENLPMYIEYGSYKNNTILLQSIGLSRTAAIAISHLAGTDFSDEKDCSNWLNLNKERIRNTISPILYKEVMELV